LKIPKNTDEIFPLVDDIFVWKSLTKWDGFKKGGVMEISVTEDKIKDLLLEAKTQFVSFSISNSSGRWTDEYFQLHGISEFKHGDEELLVVLLRSPKNSESQAIDVRLIHGIKFNKYMHLNGKLFDEIKIVSKDATLQLSR
jgi:hypothetical protein